MNRLWLRTIFKHCLVHGAVEMPAAPRPSQPSEPCFRNLAPVLLDPVLSFQLPSPTILHRGCWPWFRRLLRGLSNVLQQYVLRTAVRLYVLRVPLSSPNKPKPLRRGRESPDSPLRRHTHCTTCSRQAPAASPPCLPLQGSPWAHCRALCWATASSAPFARRGVPLAATSLWLRM